MMYPETDPCERDEREAQAVDAILRETVEPELRRIFGGLAEAADPRDHAIRTIGFADAELLDCLALPPQRQLGAMLDCARRWRRGDRAEFAEHAGLFDEARDVAIAREDA